MIRKSALKGFTTPNMKERLIISMFADDTTVYLAEDDDFNDLTMILEKWCIASGAKFNVGKTEIIPIGDAEYRKEVISTRKSRDDSSQIPDSIHIAKDGEPVRALGAFVGNNIENGSVWTPTIEKIEASLKRWAKSFPTLDGKRLIVNMEVGGRTQYRTMVQGMSEATRKYLDKLIRQFYWGGNSAYVGADTTNLPHEMGGLKGLSLTDKIKAIHAMRAVRLLDLENQPRWAIITNHLLSKNIPSQFGPIDQRSARNMYLQNWEAAKRESKSAASFFTREMIKTTDELGLRLWTNHPSEKVKRDMPIWLHPASKKGRTASDASTYWTRCQRDKHKITTVGEMTDFVSELDTHVHVPHTDPERDSVHDCACEMCATDEAKGCLAQASQLV
ncbi:hypothetical protein DFP72DRAFT_804563 [Ephemerocybe angulata]|uniref:Reverse transcriptase domain-containing protein n=1 Tax=Ephemerocybe angulata TaxID=980116 RepID=A0A8H6I8I0_9AGAR|nr:hypothetical protein DFP72DRAFT_804563 [Tulosesus angulatus]